MGVWVWYWSFVRFKEMLKVYIKLDLFVGDYFKGLEGIGWVILSIL